MLHHQNLVMRIHVYWIRTVHWSSFSSSSSYNTLAATLYTTHCSVHVLLKIEKGGIDKAGGKQEDQWNIVCLCAPENGSFCVQGTFVWVSVHEWTVILQVLKQAHLPPSSWHHLHNCIPHQIVHITEQAISRQTVLGKNFVLGNLLCHQDGTKIGVLWGVSCCQQLQGFSELFHSELPCKTHKWVRGKNMEPAQ